MTNKHWTSVYEFVISLTPSKQIVLSGRGVHIFCQIKGSWYEHGGLESTEIQKKMPGFVTHIFWLDIPNTMIPQKFDFKLIEICYSPSWIKHL